LSQKGWDESIFNLNKSHPKGTLKMVMDEDSGMLCIRWVDSKVAQGTGAIINTQVGDVLLPQISDKEATLCPEAIMHNQNYVCGVDKGDQTRAHGGGFPQKAHGKK